MKSPREIAHEFCREHLGDDWCCFSWKHLAQRPHSFACDRLTSEIELYRREVVAQPSKEAERE